MMKRAFFILCLVGLSLRAWGSDPVPSPLDTPSVESTWHGIEMHVSEVKRIAGNRLLVVVLLWATPKAPPATMIGIPPVIPPNATKEELNMGLGDSPFSLAGSTMTDDLTQQKYDMVPPDPKGPLYRSSVILTSLFPGRGLYMTIQFLAPPPPPPDDTGKIPKQTVSILLPKAKGPITKVVVPPPTPPAPGQ